MEVEFVGAAQTVTGSMHLVHTEHGRILLDCGLFQGRRKEAYARNSKLPIDATSIDAVVLSHAHIDHSGCLPLLLRRGFRGTVYATPATRDLCTVMLEDAAMIQQHDARYINKVIERDHVDMEPVEPLYDRDDVIKVLERMIAVPYRIRHPIAPGIDVTFLDAGHVLGSAIVMLDVDDVGEKKRLVFTGDLGRIHMPILRDPEIATGGHVLITESTYGDRLHGPIEELDDNLAAVLKRTFDRRGKVIVPSFALERAQEVVYALKRLRKQGRMPPMPVYVDSPLTVKITDVFKRHPDCYDHETLELLRADDSPFEFDGLRYVADVESSKQVTMEPGSSVIISASGMCESGRVLHHLKATVEDKRNTVMIVGFQAPHTLGRRIVERRPLIRIFGVERDLRAEVVVMNGFSAHADQSDLLAYAERCRDRGPLRQVALVHGEPKAQAVLKGLLEDRRFPEVHIPAPGDRLRL
ncbi:MAG: MBL fold metallo-hydrolase [Deltaproteobacteria bacterium]|nr:MBL fold metallo-hydrolase [Deltaproteobacteria bacterium]